MYEPKTKMVRDANFLHLDVNDSYNYNMNLVDLSDQLWNVYRFDHLMRNYKWWWYLLFWGHGLVLVNDDIIYKTLCEEDKMKPMINYEFWHLVCFAKIDPTIFCSRDHLVSAVQQRGIRKKDGYITTTTASARIEIGKKRKYRKRKLDTEKSAATIKISSMKALGKKAPRVNDDALQPGGALDRRLNHENPHCPMTLTGSGVAFQLC